MDFPQHVIERFWRKVDKSAGPDGCWLWTDRLTNGYGNFYYHNKKDRVRMSAHRYSLIFSGVLPTEINNQALHSCDVRSCCNPKHLRWGTALDNIIDRRERNTTYKQKNIEHLKSLWANMPEKMNPRRIITDESKLKLAFDMRKNGMTYKQISEALNVKETTLHYNMNKPRKTPLAPHTPITAQQSEAVIAKALES